MRNHQKLLVAILVAMALVIGCAARKEFSAVGYKHPVHGFTLNYVQKKLRAFIDPFWKISNYDYDYIGTRQMRKRDSTYYGNIAFDRDSDGHPEMEKGYFADLELQHDATDGIMWICSRDLMPGQEKIPYQEFLAHYINSLVGEKRLLCGDVFGYVPTEKYFDVFVEKTESVDLGQLEGMAANIELKISEDAYNSPGKVRVVFTKIDSTVTIWRDSHERGTHFQEPGKVLVIIGYFNSAYYFDGQLPDFDKFVNQIYFQSNPSK